MVEGMLKMMAVFAELDRKMKVYQINLGLKNAVKSGKTLGRPKTTGRESAKQQVYSSSSLYLPPL